MKCCLKHVYANEKMVWADVQNISHKKWMTIVSMQYTGKYISVFVHILFTLSITLLYDGSPF